MKRLLKNATARHALYSAALVLLMGWSKNFFLAGMNCTAMIIFTWLAAKEYRGRKSPATIVGLDNLATYYDKQTIFGNN